MGRDRLRVLHLAKYFPPEPGGMEGVVRDLAEAQAAAGHEVLVLAHAGRVPPGRDRPAPRLALRRFPVRLLAGGGYAPLAPGLWRAVRTESRVFKPDVIHLHCPNPAGAALWRGTPAPLVLHWHADVAFPPDKRPPAWQRFLWAGLERRLLNLAGRIIVASPDYAATSESLEAYQSKCRAVPLGLDPAPPEPRPNPAAGWLAERPEGSRVLAVGRLAHFKGFTVLLEALARLPGASLLLMGEGEERPRLERQLRALGLEARVRLAGAASPAEIEAALRAADVFCLPSLSRAESFGLVLLEAMRAGRACVATSVPGSGMSLAVRPGETGLLAKPGDPDDLAEALASLLKDRSRRDKFGAAGRERFLSGFTLKEAAAKIEAVYREIAGGGRT